MKKIFIFVVFLVSFVMGVLSFLFVLNGSLEIAPTSEQDAKIRLVFGIFSTVFLGFSAFMFYIFKKLKK